MTKQTTYKQKLTEILKDRYDISYEKYIERLDSISSLVTFVDGSVWFSRYPTIYAILGVFGQNYYNYTDGCDDTDRDIDYEYECEKVDFLLSEWFCDHDTTIEDPKTVTNEELMCLGLWNFISCSSHTFIKEEILGDMDGAEPVEYDLCSLEIKDWLEDEDFAENCYCEENNCMYHSNGEYAEKICERFAD